MIYLILFISILASTVRAVFAKGLNTQKGDVKRFFVLQGASFVFGLAMIALLSFSSLCVPSSYTVFLAALYAIALIASQWLYTLALNTGSVCICTMVYAFGFIIPTVLGSVIWHEKMGVLQLVGVGLVIISIVLSSLGKKEEKNSGSNAVYFIALGIGFLSSGSLGLLQKFQQKSGSPDELGMFLIIAFAISAAVSYIASVFSPSVKNAESRTKKQYINALVVGAGFGFANIANTYLAGVLDSAILFPLLNIGCILATLAASVIFLHEKLSRIEKIALVLGVLSILVISAGNAL